MISLGEIVCQKCSGKLVKKDWYAFCTKCGAKFIIESHANGSFKSMRSVDGKMNKKLDSEALKGIKNLAQEESDFYDKHGYFSFWSDELKAQKIKDSKTEKKECEKKVYCNQCSDFINKFLFGGKAYCKQGYNCYEHAKTLIALFPNKEASGGENTVEGKGGVKSMTPNNTDSKLPEPKTEPEKNEEPWECPICHKTVYIGYTTHRHCLDKLMEEPEKYPKVVYQLGTDSKEYMELKKKYDKLIEGFIKFIDHFEERYEGKKCGECLEYWKTIKEHYKGV